MTNISWVGSDPRFYHRKGGSDGGNGQWRDAFGEENQNDYVCAATIPVDAGNHVLAWSIQMIFAAPVCSSASERYPAFSASVIIPNVTPRFALLSQAYVCAKRNDLVWSGEFTLIFPVPKSSNVSVGLSAFNDQSTSDPTSTGAKEAIVQTMKIYPYVSNASVDNIVWPFEVGAD